MSTRYCTSCTKAVSALPDGVQLKICARCKTGIYCSKDCQAVDWPTHKLICSKPVPWVKGDKSGTTPWASFSGDTLHNRSEAETYKLLIDVYRLRVEDEYVFTGDASTDSLYGGGSPKVGFWNFLDKAEKKQGVLPPWWNRKKRLECLKLVARRKGWSDLGCAVE